MKFIHKITFNNFSLYHSMSWNLSWTCVDSDSYAWSKPFMFRSGSRSRSWNLSNFKSSSWSRMLFWSVRWFV